MLETLTQSSMVLVGSLFALLLAVGLVWFFIVSSDRRTLCIAYLVLAFLFEIFMHKQPYVSLGLQLYLNDVISLILVSAILLGWLSRPLPFKQGALLVWLALGAVIMTSFGLGLGSYGKAAGTEVREYFYYWAAGLYCCTANFDEAQIRRIARWLVWGAYGLIGIALYRWIGVALGFVPASLLKDVGVTSDFRVLPSSAAFCLCAAGLLQTMAWLRRTGSRWSGWHAVIFTAFVLILQHRSVWVAHGVAVLYLFAQERRHLPSRFPLLLGASLFAGMALSIAAMFGVLDGLFDALRESATSVTKSQSSVTDRVFGWESLVADWSNSSIGTLLLGYPFGHGWRRVIDGRIIEFSPHNFYVDLLLRVGVVGLALMLLATLMAMVHGLRAKTESEHEYLLLRGLGLVLLAALFYYVPYSGNYLHGAITGLALAQMIRLRQRNHVPAPQPGGAWRGAAARKPMVRGGFGP